MAGQVSPVEQTGKLRFREVKPLGPGHLASGDPDRSVTPKSVAFFSLEYLPFL